MLLVPSAPKDYCEGIRLRCSMPGLKADIERQLQRQSLWMKDYWLWLLRTQILKYFEPSSVKPTALDVGCGPGFVLEQLSPVMKITGIDIDRGMVKACKAKGLDVKIADARDLPYNDNSFDIAYCSFLLLWVPDPQKVISEMKRVSSHAIVCFAEPDFGARLDYPDELSELRDLIVEGIKEEGGDPLIGRKLRSLFNACGLKAKMGVHPGIWSIDRLKEEAGNEWRWIEMTVSRRLDKTRLERLRTIWMRSAESGELFQFNPIFYAYAKKR